MSIYNNTCHIMLPWWLSSKESTCQAGATGLIPHLGRSPGGQHGNPLQFLLGKSHGQRSLAGYSPWDHRVRPDWSDAARMRMSHYRSSYSFCQQRSLFHRSPSLTRSSSHWESEKSIHHGNIFQFYCCYWAFPKSLAINKAVLWWIL